MKTKTRMASSQQMHSVVRYLHNETSAKRWKKKANNWTDMELDGESFLEKNREISGKQQKNTIEGTCRRFAILLEAHKDPDDDENKGRQTKGQLNGGRGQNEHAIAIFLESHRCTTTCRDTVI